MWFELKGDARLGRCATEMCGGQPTWRLETGGTGSKYCSGCKSNIIADMHCREIFAENVKYGGMP